MPLFTITIIAERKGLTVNNNSKSIPFHESAKKSLLNNYKHCPILASISVVAACITVICLFGTDRKQKHIIFEDINFNDRSNTVQ